MSDKLNILENTVRVSFAGVVWSHKIQEKQADICGQKYKKLETVRIIASSLTAVGIIGIVFVDGLWLKLASSLVSFVAVVISALFKSFSTQELSSAHKKAAYTLLIVRDKYQHLLMEIRVGIKSFDELDNEYSKLESEKHQAYSDSPNTSDKAVKLASQALKIIGDNTYTDDEINNFLPKSLWKIENRLSLSNDFKNFCDNVVLDATDMEATCGKIAKNSIHTITP